MGNKSELGKIFREGLNPQRAAERLLTVLCSPAGMEKFVVEHNGELYFQQCTFNDRPGYLVYSSMTPKGFFFQKEAGIVWCSTVGKDIPCITMALDETIGKAVKDAYIDARANRYLQTKPG